MNPYLLAVLHERESERNRMKLLYIGIGGFLGAVSRYLVSGLFQKWLDKPFPVGTLAVNVIGCFLIGLLSGLSQGRQLFTPEMRLFLFIGFLGGLTTFSTFIYEIFTFARDGQIIPSLANLTLHLVLGIAAIWAGFAISRIT